MYGQPSSQSAKQYGHFRIENPDTVDYEYWLRDAEVALEKALITGNKEEISQCESDVKEYADRLKDVLSLDSLFELARKQRENVVKLEAIDKEDPYNFAQEAERDLKYTLKLIISSIVQASSVKIKESSLPLIVEQNSGVCKTQEIESVR